MPYSSTKEGMERALEGRFFNQPSKREKTPRLIRTCLPRSSAVNPLHILLPRYLLPFLPARIAVVIAYALHETLECLPPLRLSSRKNIPASRFQHAAWELRSSSPFPIPLSKAPCPAQDSNTAKHEASCLSAGPLKPCFSKMVNEKYPRLKNALHGHSFYSSLLSRYPIKTPEL